jgi:hypothetical protein
MFVHLYPIQVAILACRPSLIEAQAVPEREKRTRGRVIGIEGYRLLEHLPRPLEFAAL